MFELPILLALVGVFTCVALVVGAATTFVLDRRSLTRKRFFALTSRHGAADAASAGTLLNDGPRPSAVQQRFGMFLPKSAKEMSRLQRRLAAAGIHHPAAPVAFVCAELVLSALGFLGSVYGMGWSGGLMYGLVAAVVGYVLPGIVIDRRVAAQRKLIQNGLPDALDLLIVCLEAGLGIDQAIVKCAEELELVHPGLAEELRMINVECRAGKPRIEAFRNFATRTKVDDVRALVSMLVQTDRFGTSVAQALRTAAEESRLKRRQRAEERAATLGVKLVFPLVFCLFPAFYIVALGPAVLKFLEATGPGGALGGN